MKWADEFRGNFGVRANADIPRDAKAARQFGAEGIGLCRTEHMFFAEDRIPHMQAMILARDEKTRTQGAAEAAAHAAQGFRGPVQGHGRLPGGDPHARSAAARIPAQARRPDGGSRAAAARRHQDEEGDVGEVRHPGGRVEEALPELLHRVEELHEFNPMLGHRGCRLGITYPEITEMQARAIFEAAVQVAKKGVKVIPEVMIPLVGSVKELENQKDIVERVAKEVLAKAGMKNLQYMIGTMIEIPRAALTADKIAEAGRVLQLRHQRSDADHHGPLARRLYEVLEGIRGPENLQGRSVRRPSIRKAWAS